MKGFLISTQPTQSRVKRTMVLVVIFYFRNLLISEEKKSNVLAVYISYVRGAFGKYVAQSFFSVADKQTHSCLVSF